MATVASPAAEPIAAPPSRAFRVGESLNIWQAPLVPLALAVTAGILGDRVLRVPLPISFLAIVASLAAWATCVVGPRGRLALIYLWGSAAALGAAWHHAYRHVRADDDITHHATADPVPVVLRGLLETEPVVVWRPKHEPLRTIPATDTTRAVLRVTHIKQLDLWERVSGQFLAGFNSTLRALCAIVTQVKKSR